MNQPNHEVEPTEIAATAAELEQTAVVDPLPVPAAAATTNTGADTDQWSESDLPSQEHTAVVPPAAGDATALTPGAASLPTPQLGAGYPVATTAPNPYALPTPAAPWGQTPTAGTVDPATTVAPSTAWSQPGPYPYPYPQPPINPANLPPAGYAYYQPAAQSSSNALIALLLAIFSWIFCPIVLAVVGLILASKADKEIAASGGRVTGAGMTLATRIIAWGNIALYGAMILATVFFIVIAMVAAFSESGGGGLSAIIGG